MQGGMPLQHQQGQQPMMVSGEDALREARAASGARAPQVTRLSSAPPPLMSVNPFALGGPRQGPRGLLFRYDSAARLDSPAPPSVRQARSRDARRSAASPAVESQGLSPVQSQDLSDAYTAILTRLDAIEARSRDHAQCMEDMMGAMATRQSLVDPLTANHPTTQAALNGVPVYKRYVDTRFA